MTTIDETISATATIDETGKWGPTERTIRYFSGPRTIPGLEKVQQDLLKYASSEGIDLDALIEAASRHFVSGDVGPNSSKESKVDFDVLVDDELNETND